MADPFATDEDLSAFWRPLDAEEGPRAVTLLRIVSALIRSEFSDIDDRIEAGTLDIELPKFVACAAVKQAMIAGELAGVDEMTETAGPFAHTNRYSNPMGNLYLTREWRRMLRSGGAGRRAFTVNPMAANAGEGFPV